MTLREEILQFRAFALPQPTREYLGAHRRWRQIRAAALQAARDPDRIRIALLGFSTLAGMESFLEVSVLGAGLVPETYICPYNQFFQEALDPDSEFYAFAPHLTFALCPLEDLLEAQDRKPEHLPPARRRRAVHAAVARLGDALDAIRRNCGSTVFVCNMCRPDRVPGGFSDLAERDGIIDLFDRANRELARRVAALSDAHLFDLEGILMRKGVERGRDPRNTFIGDVRFSDETLLTISHQIAWLAAALRGKTKKALVLDLDDTLWGGTVGEDGIDGLRIDDDPAGRPFRAFQDTLLDLYRKGVILAICSKNNYEDADGAFQRREMPLSMDHFAATRINWSDKADNIVSIAEELNIGLDSMVFLDNSPTERAWVSTRLPDVLVPDLPDLPSFRPDFLRYMPVFDRLSLTAEDRQRPAMYAEERKRRAFESSVSREDFLRQLQLTVTVLSDPLALLNRLSQLTQRTNQFNLTTQRYSPADIENRLSDAATKVVAVTAKDRFGDYGIIGLAIARQDSHARAIIDTFLLSCRIIGKSVECVLLHQIAEWARDCGCAELIGTYLPTPKNGLVKDFYPQHGFTPLDDHTFALDLARREPQVPTFIAVVT